MHGLRAVELPTHPRDGLDLAALRAALDRCRVRACVITNVNNPLGSCMPEDARRDLVAWVELPPRADALDLYARALKAGIAIAPGPLFGARAGAYRNFIRLNATWMGEDAERAIEKLGRLVV